VALERELVQAKVMAGVQSFAFARTNRRLVLVGADWGFALVRAKPGFGLVGTLRAASRDRGTRQLSGMLRS
jgi:hypothetical protein